jgi:hypothetical protein
VSLGGMDTESWEQLEKQMLGDDTQSPGEGAGDLQRLAWGTAGEQCHS